MSDVPLWLGLMPWIGLCVHLILTRGPVVRADEDDVRDFIRETFRADDRIREIERREKEAKP